MKVYLSEQGGPADGHLLASSRYRPFIGVSVSSRLLPLDVAVKVLSWVLHSPSPVLPVLIADEIAVINYKAFKRYSIGNCIKKALHDAEQQLTLWRQAATQLPPEQSRRVRFVRWAEIVTPAYQRQTAIVRAEFARGGLLQQAILAQVENFIRHTGKTVTMQRCLDLAEYVIQELSLLLFGIEVDGARHQLLVYPTNYSTDMERLIIDIRRKPAFAEFLAALRDQHLEDNKIVQLIISGQRFEKTPSLQPTTQYDRTRHEQVIDS